MSLEICPDCKKEVSTRAPNCPHCGHPFDDEYQLRILKARKWAKVSISGAFVILSGLVLIGIVNFAIGLLVVLLGFGLLGVGRIGFYINTGRKI